MLSLEREEARHGRRERQPVRIGRIDPAHQRLGDPLEGFLPQPAPDEAPETLVPVGAPPRQGQVEAEPELPPPGEDARRQHRPRAGRGQEEEPVGQRPEPPAAHDVGPPESVVRPPEPGTETDALGEGERPGLLGDERVRPGLEEKAVGALGPDRPAQPRRRLQEDDLDRAALVPPELHEAMGGREAGDPAPDDHDPGGAPVLRAPSAGRAHGRRRPARGRGRPGFRAGPRGRG